jgi:uncharacterized protein (TIGR03435 family)
MRHGVLRRLHFERKALVRITGMFFVAALIAVGLLEGVAVRAQTVSPDLRFEVASVKPAVPTPGVPGRRTTGIPGPNNNDPGRFSARTTLLSLVLTAYDVPIYRLSDPDDRLMPLVEVEAEMPADTTRQQFNVMLQNLLADRLGLKVHWAGKKIEMYALVVAKGGPKLKPAAPDSPQGKDDGCGGANCRLGSDGFPIPPPGNSPWVGVGPAGKMVMRGHNQTIEELARAIGQRTLDGPLNDATGLTGKYDYTIFWSMTAQTAALNPLAAGEPDGPSIFDAVERQLGLKIEKRRGPEQVLVIDHVEKKPTEN